MRGGMSQIWVLGKLVQTIVSIVLTNHVQELEADHLPYTFQKEMRTVHPNMFFSNVFPLEKWRVLVKQIRNPCPFNANDVPLDSCENRLLVATRPSKWRSEYSWKYTNHISDIKSWIYVLITVTYSLDSCPWFVQKKTLIEQRVALHPLFSEVSPRSFSLRRCSQHNSSKKHGSSKWKILPTTMV